MQIISLEFLKLKKRVIDNNNLNIYLNNLNDNKIDHPMWWENIFSAIGGGCV